MGRTNSTSGQRGARNHKHSNLQQIVSIFNKENTTKSNMPKGGGLTKPMKLSDDLAAIVGRKSASRAKCMKYLWAYLKKNNLQCEDNKQYFLPDKKMAKIFGTEKCRGFGMAKFIGEHLLGPSSDVEEEEDSEEENKPKNKPEKAKPAKGKPAAKKKSKKQESEEEESEPDEPSEQEEEEEDDE